MKDYRRIFTLTVAALLALYGAAGAFFLPYARFYSDLARMGMLPEKDFLWRKPQPTIDADFMVNSKLAEADVLVIGDSFSDPWMWQSELVRHGVKVQSLQWGQVRGVCGDIAGWLAAHGFKGKRVVIESVEWKLETVLQASLNCSAMPADVPDPAGKRGAPLPTIDESAPIASGKMSVGLRTVWHGWRYSQARAQPGFTQQAFAPVTVHRIADGCALFSHRRCEDALFLDYEMENEAPGKTAIAQMKQVEQRLPGYQVTWLVVPNKSTIYLQADKSFWRDAGKELHVPDVQAGFRELVARREVVDLYKPNDTHLSTAGYLALGRIAYRSMTTAEHEPRRK